MGRHRGQVWCSERPCISQWERGCTRVCPHLTLLAPILTGHFALCAFQCGQKHEVFVPGPHVQRDTGDQAALQKAAAHEVRRWLTQSKTNPRGPQGNGCLMAPCPRVPRLALRRVLAILAIGSVLTQMQPQCSFSDGLWVSTSRMSPIGALLLVSAGVRGLGLPCDPGLLTCCSF